MLGILLLSHGNMCEGVLNAMGVLGCSVDKMLALPLYMETELEAYTQAMERAIDALDTGDGVLVIADLLSGTPFNRACTLCETKNIAVLTGMNLPMCITASELRSGAGLREIAEECAREGRDGIVNLEALMKQLEERGSNNE